MGPGQGLRELIFQQNKRRDAVQFAGGELEALGQEPPPPASGPDLPVTVSGTQGRARFLHDAHRSQVLELLLPCLAGGAIADHQSSQGGVLVPVLQLGACVVGKHHEGIFDFTLAAVRQHKAAFAATGINCSDHAAKGWLSSLSYGVH